MKIHIEHTDTLGGDAKYSWVRRATLDIQDGATDKQIIRRARCWAGFAGAKTINTVNANGITIKPRTVAQIIFVTWEG